MRQLDRKEKAFSEKNIKRNAKEIKELEKSLKMLKLHKDFRLKKRAYDDILRPYNQEKEDKESENMINQIESDIAIKENTIKVTLKQIEEGVEDKIPPGVK